jgi:hypothetical protein
MNDTIRPMPEPQTEEPQLVPGGVDAIEEDPADVGLLRDPEPDLNPAVEEQELPGEVGERDDKPQAPEGEAEEEIGVEDDTPSAGQEAEDGSTEPPA